MDRPSSFSRRSKLAVIISASLVLILIVVAAANVNKLQKPTTQVTINSTVYNLTLADTETELMSGLSGVEKLDSNGGLLMQFPSDDTWGIWMKDMKIPLDIIWLNKDKKVVYIKENVNPDLGTSTVMRPDEPCRYVLELTDGSVRRAEIRVGQQTNFTIEGDK